MDFVQSLSTENRNVFQKIFDEIKYLCKVATAGSKEARQLLEVKKIFEEVYRAETKNTVVEDGVRYALANNEDITPDTDQLVANAKAVTEMGSVCKIAADKLLDSGKDIKEIYAVYFSRWGENIHSDIFGDIATKKSSIGSEFAHGNTAEKIASIEAIPSVIENGKIVDWFEKTKGLFRITVAAPIEIGNTVYYMGVMLQRDSQNQRLYIHDVILEKEASASTQDHLSTKGPYSGNKNLFMSSILRKARFVNRQYWGAVQNGDIKERRFPTIDGSSAKGGALRGKSSNVRISETDANVKYSLRLIRTRMGTLFPAAEKRRLSITSMGWMRNTVRRS